MFSNANPIVIPSGCQIDNPAERLLQFCREEYEYYDRIPSPDPDHIAPLDVLAAVAVNAFSAHAAAIRRSHRGLVDACDPLLSTTPEDADLLTFDPSLKTVETLLHASMQVPGVLIPVATKVLHRKRPNLIPILDNVVLAHYLDTLPQKLPTASQDKRRGAAVAVHVLSRFRDDLREAQPAIQAVRHDLAAHGFALTRVRILELLVWTQVEERGYYR